MWVQLEPLAIILHWLWLYPLCEVQELASASQVSESTVYRLLANLIRNGWVEVVRHPGLLATARSQHYLLTSFGWEQLVKAHCVHGRTQGMEPEETKERILFPPFHGHAATWNAYERHVLRLIPRLPYGARLRQFLLTFFRATPREQAMQGYPANVRWHWLPDYRYVCQYRQRPLTVSADAVFAWHCAAVSGHGDASPLPVATVNNGSVSAQWYCAFVLLETGLTDMAMIRERLRRFLCYRECPERWSCYHAFPPVLVLVEHPHQIEYWQRATHEASATLRCAAIAGAIAVLPVSSADRPGNPWHLPWRDLATLASCSLRHLFQPVAQSALPGGVENHLVSAVSLLQGQEASGARLVCSYQEQRARAKTTIRNRGTRKQFASKRVLHVFSSSSNALEYIAGKSGQRWTPRDVAQVSMGLGQRHSALLTLLCRYPLLARDELAAICGLEEATVARYLRELQTTGVLCTWQSKTTGTNRESRWYLSEQGLRLLAAIHHVPVQHLGEFRTCTTQEKEPGASSHKTLVPGGLATLQRYPVHLAGVYSCIAALFHAADTHAATVVWWEAGDACARSYRYHSIQQNLRPDAAFELLFPMQQGETRRKRVRYWLEWDNGTMGRRDLEAKFQSYARYCQSKAWVTDSLRFLPHLLFIVPDTGQETRIASAAMSVQDTGLHVFVTTAGHVRANGLFSAIWRQVMPGKDEQERRELIQTSQ